jgi:hypothetical protein
MKNSVFTVTADTRVQQIQQPEFNEDVSGKMFIHLHEIASLLDKEIYVGSDVMVQRAGRC